MDVIILFVVFWDGNSSGAMWVRYAYDHWAVALHNDIECLQCDTVRGEKQQRNVLSVTHWLSLLLTAHYSCHIVQQGFPILLEPFWSSAPGAMRGTARVSDLSLAMLYLCWASILIKALQLVRPMGDRPTVCLPRRIFGMAALADQSEIFIQAKCLCASTGVAVYVKENRHS